MDNYEDKFFEMAEKEVDELREDALKTVQRKYPEIQFVVDRHTIDDYVLKRWDYPGKWYYAGFKLPDGFHSKRQLINSIVEETLRYFGKKKR